MRASLVIIGIFGFLIFVGVAVANYDAAHPCIRYATVPPCGSETVCVEWNGGTPSQCQRWRDACRIAPECVETK